MCAKGSSSSRKNNAPRVFSSPRRSIPSVLPARGSHRQMHRRRGFDEQRPQTDTGRPRAMDVASSWLIDARDPLSVRRVNLGESLLRGVISLESQGTVSERETCEGSERRHRNFLTVLDKSRRFLDLRRSLSSATPLPRPRLSLSFLQVYFVIVSFPFDSSRDHQKLGPPGIVSASLVKGSALSIATEIQ